VSLIEAQENACLHLQNPSTEWTKEGSTCTLHSRPAQAPKLLDSSWTHLHFTTCSTLHTWTAPRDKPTSLLKFGQQQPQKLLDNGNSLKFGQHMHTFHSCPPMTSSTKTFMIFHSKPAATEWGRGELKSTIFAPDFRRTVAHWERDFNSKLSKDLHGWLNLSLGF
jgi:hypothetical protein